MVPASECDWLASQPGGGGGGGGAIVIFLVASCYGKWSKTACDQSATFLRMKNGNNKKLGHCVGCICREWLLDRECFIEGVNA